MVIAAALAIAAAGFFGIHPRIEESGSMAPALRPGDLLFVQSIRPSEARPGQIITFPAPGRGIELTHRAINVTRSGNRISFVTRGDASTGVERWSVSANGRIGREVLALPAVGGVIQSLRGAPLVVAIWLVAPFVLLAVLRRIWRRT
jgi:signal peptidase